MGKLLRLQLCFNNFQHYGAMLKPLLQPMEEFTTNIQVTDFINNAQR